MDRKKFIRICGIAAVGVPMGLLYGCTGYYYADFKRESDRLVVPLTEFGAGDKARSFVLLDSPISNYPICIFKTDEQYVASLMKCTHKGCEINVEGMGYSCPCHGSEFSNTGEVLEGPAKEPLKTFKTRIDEENLYVQIN